MNTIHKWAYGIYLEKLTIFFSTFLPIACGIKYFSFQLVSSLHDFLKYCT